MIERRRAWYARIPGEREEPWGLRAGRTRADFRSDFGHKSVRIWLRSMSRRAEARADSPDWV